MKGITKHVKIHLHHRRDADLIRFIKNHIEPGDFAQTVIEGLRLVAQGASPQVQHKPAGHPVCESPTLKPVNVVTLDDSEGFN